MPVRKLGGYELCFAYIFVFCLQSAAHSQDEIRAKAIRLV